MPYVAINLSNAYDAEHNTRYATLVPYCAGVHDPGNEGVQRQGFDHCQGSD